MWSILPSSSKPALYEDNREEPFTHYKASVRRRVLFSERSVTDKFTSTEIITVLQVQQLQFLKRYNLQANTNENTYGLLYCKPVKI